MEVMHINQAISDEAIEKIESALNVRLYDWQKTYLKGDDSAMPNGGRRNGKTFAHCVRLALSEGEPIRTCDLRNWADGHYNTGYVNRWFPRFFLDIWYTLKDAGLSVRVLTRNNIEIT